MADNGQKTEQPSPQRLQKARREGRFPVSREFTSGVHFLAFVTVLLLLWRQGASALATLWRTLFDFAASADVLTTESVIRLYRVILFPFFSGALLIGLGLSGFLLLAQLASTGFGISAHRLMPEWNRLNPMTKITQLPKENFRNAVRSLMLIFVAGIFLYLTVIGQLPEIETLSGGSLSGGLSRAGGLASRLLRQMAWALAIFGAVDLYRQRSRFRKSMRMSKQELKDEMRNSEGNPEVKIRIRRLQRDAARKNMIKAVEKAAVVIVNPTHYAIALQYEMGSRSVPTVTAKGKNFLAKIIRERAREYNVPIIENKPLAQALYQTADVGNEIPPALYRAVAEVLAQIYRIINR